MNRRAFVGAALAPPLMAGLARAQAPPGAAERFRTLDYRADSVFPLACRLGYATTIVFAPDEEIQSIAIGDAGSWQATPSKSGAYLFLKPVAPSATNMTVVTSARAYVFDLSVGEDGPYLVRFRYPAPPTEAVEAVAVAPGRYHIHGARDVRPAEMSDDGVHVFIAWAANVSLPAVYAVGDDGKETLLNGAMRGGRYVIDSINPRLVFRRDRSVAFAERVTPRSKATRR